MAELTEDQQDEAFEIQEDLRLGIDVIVEDRLKDVDEEIRHRVLEHLMENYRFW